MGKGAGMPENRDAGMLPGGAGVNRGVGEGLARTGKPDPSTTQVKGDFLFLKKT